MEIKAMQALDRYLDTVLRFPCGHVTLDSPLPKAKGYGSSTADIAAVLFAIGVFHRSAGITGKQVAKMAVQIEPSDGLMGHGLVLFDHRGGKVYELLGCAPDVGVLVLEFEGAVDTLAYNEDYQAERLAEMRVDHEEALGCVKRGIRTGNPWELGYGTTLSARCHQRILYKPQLETVIQAAEWEKGYGVVVAHSGTLIGVLCDRPEELVGAFREMPGIVAVRPHRMVGGGPRYGD
jgi:L-threonine kinase